MLAWRSAAGKKFDIPPKHGNLFPLMYLKVISVWIILGLGVTTLAQSSAAAVRIPIVNFSQVTPFIYRGARPTEEGVKALAALHIKTDLNIDSDKKAIAAEATWANAQGLQYISIPLSGFFAPTDEQMDRVFKVLRDPSNYPIFLHCKHGEDRTGLTVGLYRYYDEHWSAEAAYQEMLDHGFHRILWELNSYFKKKTGLTETMETLGDLQ